MVGAYVRMRQQQKRDESTKRAFTHTSPRTLLGVLRISQALARLRFADAVITEDVDEALRLVEVSKASLYTDERGRGDQTPSSKIYHLVRGMKDSGAAAVGDGSGELDLRRVRERVLAKGFTADQFEDAVDEYSLLDVSSILSLSCVLLLTWLNRFGKLLLKERDLCLLKRRAMRLWISDECLLMG
jgi:DNA replication licensing factor MCM7